MRQKTADDLLVHVRNDGDPNDPLVWGVETSAHLDYADSSDVVGLLCIRPAKSGGVSTIVSAVAVHDEIVRRRPDLPRLRHEDWWHDRRLGDGPENFFRCPVFATNEAGALFSHYGRAYLESAGRGAGIPALTERQLEALDQLDELTNDPGYVLNMNFAPGDVQFLNNYRVMHARTSYTDHPERERRRDLIRIWLVLDRDLGLPTSFETGGIIPAARRWPDESSVEQFGLLEDDLLPHRLEVEPAERSESHGGADFPRCRERDLQVRDLVPAGVQLLSQFLDLVSKLAVCWLFVAGLGHELIVFKD